MSVWLRLARALPVFTGLLIVAALTGCVQVPGAAKASEVRALRVALVSLGPTVSDTEADRVARCAYEYPRVLAEEYRVVRPAILHNFLINKGVKERGLCYHWTEDLMARLQTFDLDTLDLHWGVARGGTTREHNSVVVAAPGQPFEQGIVLDPWRRSGRLVWTFVAVDRYPWVEIEPPPSPE